MNKWLISTLLLSLLSSFAIADDTEIYVGDKSQNTVKPNIVFIFDTSGSMSSNVTYCTKYGTKVTSVCDTYENTCKSYDRRGNCKKWEATCKTYKDEIEEGVCLENATSTRLKLTKDAALDVIGTASDDKRLKGVNLAIMRYNPKRGNDSNDSNYRGGYLLTKMLDIDNSSNRTTIRNTINNDLPADGGTPMTESVHEAYNFLTGSAIDYGKSGNTYFGKTGDVRNGSNYVSPITEQCQKNHIVLFTDGDSSVDGESNTQIRSWLTALPNRPNELSTSCSSNSGGNTNITNSCIEELAYVMNNREVKLDLNGGNAAIQPITFHAIGGFIGGNSQKFLDNAAFYGGGVSANAQNYDDLTKALQKVFSNISQTAGTFAAPAVSVNAFNTLEQLDQLYYAIFKPQENVGWSGNIKRLKMLDGKIVDMKNNAAIDPSTGFFAKESRSFWTTNEDAPDGDVVGKGGMASRLANRKVYSNIVGNELAQNDNLIVSTNTKITRNMMGTTLKDAYFDGGTAPAAGVDEVDTSYTDPYSTDEFSKLVNWVGGINVDGQSRTSMEDPLHSAPVLLNYGDLSIGGKKIPDSTLFVGTNSGYLHAFDTNENNPKERFAFIPKELLPVATKYYERVGKKLYGLDGHISVWHQDTNKDMIINSGEKAYLYIGMRRGGSSYYALDVSDRDKPKLLWQINGKNAPRGQSTTAGFEELGQTWSKMLPIDIKWNGTKTKALVFGGGYDATEDNNSTRATHTVGNAIYIVDASTGALLWKATNNNNANLKLTDMKSSIVGDIVAVDDNSDGYVDLLYAADLGGRIWRIDIDQNATSANSYATGGMIADLGKSSSTIDNVRFYETPDVVYSKAFDYTVKNAAGQLTYQKGKPRYMISIGSGYRAHPLDSQAIDNFYIVFDYNTSGAPAQYTAVKRDDMQTYAATDKILPTLKANNGLVIKLKDSASAEKVLSKAVTLNNTIYFTSFRPADGTSVSGCSVDVGKTRLYTLALRSKDQLESLDTNDPNNPNNPNDPTTRRHGSTLDITDLNIPGIPSAPVVLVDPKGNDGKGTTNLLISTELIEAKGSPYPLKKTFWRELD